MDAENKKLGEIAHARRALQIYPPALTRQVCVFFLRDPNDPKEKGQTIPDDQREAAANAAVDLMTGFAKALSQPLATNWATAAYKTMHDDNESLVLPLGEIGSSGLNLRIKVDLLSEYLTLSYYLDFDAPQHNVSDERDLAVRVAQWLGAPVPATSREQVAFLFERAWLKLDSLLGITADAKFAGQTFAEFRGYIVSPAGLSVEREFKPDDRGAHFANQPPRVKITEGLGDIHKWLHDHRPFFHAVLGLDPDGNPLDRRDLRGRIDPNAVLCEMLDGGAIYGSGLGTPSASGESGDPTPIRYFIIYDGLSAQQLGRLVQRIHVLAELRHAALVDRHRLIPLSSDIRRLGATITKATDDVTQRRVFSAKPLRNVFSEFKRIGDKGTGGFAYRANRSLYYQTTLLNRLRDTKSKAIPGWQSYEAMVHRHFTQTFGTIQSNAERYRQLGARIDRLVSVYHVERQFRLSLSLALVPFFGIVITGLLLFSNLLDKFHRLPTESADQDRWLLVVIAVFAAMFLVQFGLWLGPRVLSWWRARKEN